MTTLPIYGETNATGLTMSEEDGKKLKELNNALTASNHRGRRHMLIDQVSRLMSKKIECFGRGSFTVVLVLLVYSA